MLAGALLLIRIVETTTGDTWTNLRRELQRLHVGYFTGPAGSYLQTTTLTPAQRDILTRLDITPPPRILKLTTTIRVTCSHSSYGTPVDPHHTVVGIEPGLLWLDHTRVQR